jgi:hypothetical protein
VRLTLVLCVKPPVAGRPVPYFAVNVRVYVPFVVLPLVWIAAVLLAAFDPVSDGELGEILQLEPDGAPLHDSAAVPVKPFIGVNVTL